MADGPRPSGFATGRAEARTNACQPLCAFRSAAALLFGHDATPSAPPRALPRTRHPRCDDDPTRSETAPIWPPEQPCAGARLAGPEPRASRWRTNRARPALRRAAPRRILTCASSFPARSAGSGPRCRRRPVGRRRVRRRSMTLRSGLREAWRLDPDRTLAAHARGLARRPCPAGRSGTARRGRRDPVRPLRVLAPPPALRLALDA
jgi:hypothetical protein